MFPLFVVNDSSDWTAKRNTSHSPTTTKNHICAGQTIQLRESIIQIGYRNVPKIKKNTQQALCFHINAFELCFVVQVFVLFFRWCLYVRWLFLVNHFKVKTVEHREHSIRWFSWYLSEWKRGNRHKNIYRFY